MNKENLPALQQKAISLRDYLHTAQVKRTLQDALPAWLSADRLLRIVFTQSMKNPQILDCTKESLLSAIMNCAQLGLEPLLGRAYLIPYKNSKNMNGRWVKVLECQFQPGYQGLVDLARRSGMVKDVFATPVYENDLFDIEYGTNRHITHKPHLGPDPGKPIGAYTVWELKDGTKAFEFMPLHEIYKRRARSQAYQYAEKNPNDKNAQESPWIQWPEEMMRKTVVKHFSKLMPASVEFMQAIELDDAAELGRSQAGMFSEMPDFSYSLTAPADPEPQFDTSAFDKHVAKYIDTPDPTLDKFIELTAQAQVIPIDKLKAVAGEQFDGFWKAFEAWRLQAYPDAPKVEKTGDQKNQEADDRVDCPWPNCDAKFKPKPSPGEARHINSAHGGEYPKSDDKLKAEAEAEAKRRAEELNRKVNSKHVPEYDDNGFLKQQTTEKPAVRIMSQNEMVHKIKEFPDEIKEIAYKRKSLVFGCTLLSTMAYEAVDALLDECYIVRDELRM